jgi:rhodanese-related sulfurtransferase
VANTSHHLQVLARAGLVRRRREGTHIYYQLSSERVADLWAALRDVASLHVSGFEDLVESYLGDRESLEPLTRSELASRLGDENLVLLDVRPASEYAAGHIRGARSVPIENIRELLEGLPDDTVVVAYCRGPHCVYALDAVRALNATGRRARRLDGGFPEWRRDGLPTTSPTTSQTKAL